MTAHTGPVLAVDPGKAKCGVALVGRDGSPLALRIVPLDRLLPEVSDLLASHDHHTILVGESTGRDAVLQALSPLALTLHTVPETGTTLRARALYFRDHPPRGLARLLPAGMRVPPRPVDDYAALAIALDWLAANP